MREFWKAILRGVPMSKHTFWRGLQILGIIILLATIGSAPFITTLVDNIWYRIFSWLFIILLVVLFAVAIALAPYYGMREMKRDAERKLGIIMGRLSKLLDLEDLKKSQFGNEVNWLYLVVEIIDLGKGTNRPEREIGVIFQIDSGLVYDFRPYKMWVSPILGGWEPNEPQLEIRRPPNFLKGRRSQFASERIIIKDDKLWEFVDSARQGNDITKALKVEIQLEEGKSIIPLKSYPFYSDKVNDTRK